MLFVRRLLRTSGFLSLACLMAWSVPLLTQAAVEPRPTALYANSENPSESAARLVDRGLERYRLGDYPQAIELWEDALEFPLTSEDTAIVLGNLAAASQQLGRLQEAVFHWEQALEIVRSQPDAEEQIAQILTEQSQAYDAMGQHQRAIRLLQEALTLAENTGDRATQAAIHGGLGNAYWSLGQYEEAITAHETSLDLARPLGLEGFVSTALNNLGNVYASRIRHHRYQANVAESEGEFDEAERLQGEIDADLAAMFEVVSQSIAASEAIGGMMQVRALLNYDRLLQEFENPDIREIAANRSKILQVLGEEPNSRQKVFALINLAVDLQDTADRSLKIDLLQRSIAISREIGDRRAESFALGTLGETYEHNQQYNKALQLTRDAQFAAQQVNASDSLYRWQWQAGRIYKATNQPSQALTAYRNAISTLQSIRSDIIATSQDVQFDFRDSVEPVYRELIDLLLNPETPGAKQQKLQEVLDVLELLKLAELQNFFGDECVEVSQSILSEDGRLADPNAAVVYTIILPDRTAILLQQADGTLSDYSASITAEELRYDVNNFRSLLEKRGTNEYLAEATRLYDLLVRPLEADLAEITPETLVFIQDGVLRKTPVAALYDGESFLVEKYALATTPSLQLTTASESQLTRKNALIVGLTVEVPPFAPLNSVESEVKGVQEILGGTALLDDEFTVENFENRLNDENYSIVHMATHGKFGVDSESTFLLAYHDRITIEEMDALLRSRRTSGAGNLSPLELLVLSACQTAAGDDRSALGIAGVAVRAGAKSALASLWFINDSATVPLVEEFYRQLGTPGTTKAEALRQAQLKAIDSLENNHPGVWSPFLLIGSWQ
ncbi:MAG: CHAT domain-containing protein [Baaleninema sp.]